MWNVCLVEDDPEIARSVREALEETGTYQVTVLSTAEEAKIHLRQEVPTLGILDWNLPDGSGYELCQWIRRRWNDLPLMFLTVRGEAREIVSGLQGGADDYVVKPFDMQVLLSRIQALLRRTGDVSENYLVCGSLTMDCGRCVVRQDGAELPLSPVEYQLLLQLMRSRGRVVTREQLLQELWDDRGNFVNDNTLSVAVKRLREKLRRPGCLRTIRSIGYRLEPDPEE